MKDFSKEQFLVSIKNDRDNPAIKKLYEVDAARSVDRFMELLLKSSDPEVLNSWSFGYCIETQWDYDEFSEIFKRSYKDRIHYYDTTSENVFGFRIGNNDSFYVHLYVEPNDDKQIGVLTLNYDEACHINDSLSDIKWPVGVSGSFNIFEDDKKKDSCKILETLNGKYYIFEAIFNDFILLVDRTRL